MPIYEFEIVKSAKFTVDALSKEQALSIVNHDIEYHLKKHSKGHYVSNGIEVEE